MRKVSAAPKTNVFISHSTNPHPKIIRRPEYLIRIAFSHLAITLRGISIEVVYIKTPFISCDQSSPSLLFYTLFYTFAWSILCVLSFSMRLLENGKTATMREIYYAFVKHFPAQVQAYIITSGVLHALRHLNISISVRGTPAKFLRQIDF